MAGGFVNTAGQGKNYGGHTTLYVILASVMAAFGGLMFGYDIGISGGVTSMDMFLKKFFPKVYRNKENESSNYCVYDNQGLQAFTSSLYLAGMMASFAASYTTKNWGRQPSILLGGSVFLTGAILNAAAVNLTMLIIGRILLGVGIGFACQAVPLYLSEIAPSHLRGALNIMFQLVITFGILCANLINYGTGKLEPWGWRVSLGLAAVPGIIVTVGSLFLPETPNSLIERGKLDKGRATLIRIRGTNNVDEEFNDMVEASRLANEVKHPWRNLMQSRYRPQLIVGTMIPFLNQMTGINAIMFYAPVLFKTIGFGDDASLYSAVIVGGVNVLSTLVAIAVVDKWGRKILVYQAGFQMFISQILVGVILQYYLGDHGNLSKGMGWFVVALVCVFVSAFAWSWGPILWLIPSEIFPLEVRSAGQSLAIATNLLFTFAIGQALLTMLCVFKFGLFYFFAGWVLFMTVFVGFLMPETKGVPIEEIAPLFRNHWLWKRLIPPREEDYYEQELEMKKMHIEDPK
ncbi:hypothetical protein R1sor_006569 [Riccia sorocarpa]|uniref:Major facilitator superfamily (MFS) profile domain-containing protein n=1 Tax=Riccia sorocarpa TaxID=122646 RepID=A0ABD3HND2_9MARC